MGTTEKGQSQCTCAFPQFPTPPPPLFLFSVCMAVKHLYLTCSQAEAIRCDIKNTKPLPPSMRPAQSSSSTSDPVIPTRGSVSDINKSRLPENMDLATYTEGVARDLLHEVYQVSYLRKMCKNRLCTINHRQF